MSFKKITIKEWQQFQDCQVDFHNKLTVLTGANGSGKTTILNIFARHSGWSINSLATPKREKKTGAISYLLRFFKGEVRPANELVIGHLTYGDDQKTAIQLPSANSAQYQVSLPSQQDTNCFFIPSHRTIFRYQQVTNIPTTKKNKKAAFQEVFNANKNRYLGGNSQPSTM